MLLDRGNDDSTTAVLENMEDNCLVPRLLSAAPPVGKEDGASRPVFARFEEIRLRIHSQARIEPIKAAPRRPTINRIVLGVVEDPEADSTGEEASELDPEVSNTIAAKSWLP